MNINILCSCDMDLGKERFELNCLEDLLKEIVLKIGFRQSILRNFK